MQRYRDLIKLYRNALAKDKTPLIIDCGANIGASPYYFSIEYPQSMVIGVEPESRNFARMQKHCKDLPNVKLLNNAIGSSSGFAKINDLNVGNDAFTISPASTHEGSIEIISINKIFSDYQNCFPFIVKIDIEGSEDDLFSSNTDWAAKFPIIVIEPHDWLFPRQRKMKNFLNVIHQQNREFIILAENIVSISNDKFVL